MAIWLFVPLITYYAPQINVKIISFEVIGIVSSLEYLPSHLNFTLKILSGFDQN